MGYIKDVKKHIKIGLEKYPIPRNSATRIIPSPNGLKETLINIVLLHFQLPALQPERQHSQQQWYFSTLPWLSDQSTLRHIGLDK